VSEKPPVKARAREKPQLIADEVRASIVRGELSEGDSLGHEPELVERFGVSRPSLREALRILEAEGLISVVRGVNGGVIVHEPDERGPARMAALVLRARNVPLADVFDARAQIEPMAARAIAQSRRCKASAAELRRLVGDQEDAIDDPDAFAVANARFHERLVALGGNQTLSIVAEMLNDIVVRAVTEVSRSTDAAGSRTTRRKGIQSQHHLVNLLERGQASAAERHWHSHMAVVRKVILGQDAATVVDLLDQHH
jgi:GntR family transcriptional regulator, transcriptional repressor for pyruvate dehydrogenase complex